MASRKRSCDSAFGHELALRAAKYDLVEYKKDVSEPLRAKIEDLWTGSGNMRKKFVAESDQGIRRHVMEFTTEGQDYSVEQVRSALPDELKEAASSSDLKIFKSTHKEPWKHTTYTLSMDLESMSTLIFENLVKEHDEQTEADKKAEEQAKEKCKADENASEPLRPEGTEE